MKQYWTSFTPSLVIKRLCRREYDRSRLPLATDVDDQTEPLIDDTAGEIIDFDIKTKSFRTSRFSGLPMSLLVTLTLFSFLLGGLVVGAAQLYQHQTSSTYEIMPEPCGKNPEEARQRGCHFDVISFCWLPDECYDAELSKEFDDANQLEWFLDPNRTKPITHEQIMTGHYTGLYVNWEYHIRHCTAMWKKMHRAILGNLGNRAIDGYIGVYEHTKHCEHMLLGGQGIAFDTINTRIAVKYPSCGV